MIISQRFFAVAQSGLSAVLVGWMLLMGACNCGVCEKNAPPPPPAPVATSGHFVQGPAGKLFVDDAGKGDVPVILVHGLGGDHTVWAEQMEHLRKTRRAVALDLRGWGDVGTQAIPPMTWNFQSGLPALLPSLLTLS